MLQCMYKLDDLLVKNPSYDCPKKGEAVGDLVIEQQLTLVIRLMKRGYVLILRYRFRIK